jgi:isopropylmalate/homocitrate/citramalate synthase
MRKRGVKIVNISVMDAPRTDEKFLLETVRHMGKLGVDGFRFADTVGISTPEGISYLTRRVRETLSEFPRPPIVGFHCHNDFGLGLANVFAAVKAGARMIDVTLNGLGERAGNPALAEVAVGLEAFYGVKTNIQLNKLYEISRYGAKLSGTPVPWNMPYIGERVCAEQSDGHVGIHLKNPWAFQGIKPEIFGNQQQFIVGIKTGNNILEHKIRELKLDVARDRYPQILERIRAMALQKKGGILTDEDLIGVIRQL